MNLALRSLIKFEIRKKSCYFRLKISFLCVVGIFNRIFYNLCFVSVERSKRLQEDREAADTIGDTELGKPIFQTTLSHRSIVACSASM